MVRTARGLLTAALALACLAGCNLLAGVFPDRLMGYEAFADLSAYIDAGHIGDYNFQIIRDSSSGTEYLVLATDDGTYGDDCVVVFDAALRALGHFTMAQLDRMDSANPFAGRGAMVDVSGRIVVGNRRFRVGGRSIVYQSTPPTLYGYGLAIPESATPNFANIHADPTVDPSVFKYTGYLSDWTGPISSAPQLGGGLGGKIVGVWLRDADVLMLSRRDAVPWEIFAMTRSCFQTLTLGTIDPSYFTGPVPTPDELRWNTLGYTDAGFAVYWDTPNQYILFNEFGGIVGSSAPVTDTSARPYNQRHLYGRTSGWYVLDMGDMSLERREWWW